MLLNAVMLPGTKRSYELGHNGESQVSMSKVIHMLRRKPMEIAMGLSWIRSGE
jgi:hypothetical protein